MFIEFEETPNPNTLKFLPGREILKSGTREFKSREEAASAPLALKLFDIGGVEAVFYATDFLSVTKNDDQLWDDLKPEILTALMDHFTSGGIVIEEAQGGSEDNSQLSEIDRQIQELIDTRIKPAVAQDGGNIEFVEFDEGIVYLRLEGACAGCPSASMTLKHGIESMLKHFVPEVLRVEPVEY